MNTKSSPIEARSFKAGVLVSTIMVFIIGVLLLLFFGSRIGYENLYLKVKYAIFPQIEIAVLQQEKLFLPDDILNELIKHKAVIDNAGNPTKSKRHDTILVRPDKDLRYVLNSNANISAFVMKTGEAVNLDPPLVYINPDLKLSPKLSSYIEDYSRLSYRYSISAEGHRRTVPEINSDSRILIVGDSVAFGVGVNDSETAASHLQRLAGESFSVINAGVGGYSSKTALKVAALLASKNKYDYLIYLSSQNDFPSGKKYTPEYVEMTLKRFASLKNMFPRGVIIAVFPYMEYSLFDVLLETGYSRKRMSRLDEIYSDLEKYSKKYGLGYIDMKEMVHSYTKTTGTIFSRFSLYADHAHMSPVANRMVAERMYQQINNAGMRALDGGNLDSAM